MQYLTSRSAITIPEQLKKMMSESLLCFANAPSPMLTKFLLFWTFGKLDYIKSWGIIL